MNQGNVKKLGSGWTLDEVKTFVSAAYSRDAILDVLMGYAGSALGRRAIVILGTTAMHLLKVEDWEELQAIDLETMKSTRAHIAADSPAHAAGVQMGSASQLGLMPIFDALEVSAPPTLASFAIQIAGRTAIILMGEQTHQGDESALKSLVEHVGDQLEKVIKLAKNRELPPESERIPEVPHRFRQSNADDDSFAPHMPGASQNTGEESEGQTAQPGGRQTIRLQYQDKEPEEPVFPSFRGRSDDDEIPFLAPGGAHTGASSTMFGLPLATGPVVSKDQPLEPEPVQQVSSTIQVAWEQIDETAGPVSSEVEIITPTSLEEPSNKKTLMGGIAVQAEYLRPSASVSEETPKVELPPAVLLEEDVPAPIERPVGSGTVPGGVEAAVAPAEPPTPAGAVPLAGILKTARFTRRRKITPAGISSVKEDPKVTMRAMIPLQDAEPEAELGAERSNSTRLGMQEWSEPPKEPAPIHDAWFDYFADGQSGPSAKSENSKGTREDLPPVILGSDSLDNDPRTIPPEVLERLLDSGPVALEIQESLIDLESRDRKVAFKAAEVVAEAGEQVVDVLGELFPGRLFVDRYQFTVETLPPITEHGPVLSALVRLGAPALSVVTRFLDSPSLDARFYATYLLSEISAESVLPKLVLRLFDKDQQTRAVARTLILNYKSSPQFKSSVLPVLRQKLVMAQEDLHVEVSSEMLGRLRDMEAIPLLISSMGKHAERVNKAVLTSLQLITFQYHASPYEWRQWWAESHNESRSEWLIKALDSPHEVIRFHAFDEIQRTPGLDLAYHPEQPSKLRQRAQKLLEQWFEEHPQ